MIFFQWPMRSICVCCENALLTNQTRFKLNKKVIPLYNGYIHETFMMRICLANFILFLQNIYFYCLMLRVLWNYISESSQQMFCSLSKPFLIPKIPLMGITPPLWDRFLLKAEAFLSSSHWLNFRQHFACVLDIGLEVTLFYMFCFLRVILSISRTLLWPWWSMSYI